ncbi:hypothetical protein [Phycicoccus duodecadis]|uniref:Uncharacterized protein n=1 Tax=Phycicoccus duodecadis TaxID=173053 RepID=A0A2N3YJX4_9MICO|nr:hypothetical protein [Phycicoccus duodecadis]PKW27145.1 hypothetical protein ATL31_1981 [Phycicoccus duodecadis]
MPLRPDPERARAALAALDAVREVAATGEDDVLACLVVTGEPAAQRVLDDWLDQVADTLRALGETADELALALAGHQGAVGADPSGPAAADRQVTPLPGRAHPAREGGR